MHTNPSYRQRHRTSVALPLFALLCLVSLKGAWSVKADLVQGSGIAEATKEQKIVTVSSQEYLILQPGASVDLTASKALEGETVLNTIAEASLQAGAFTLSGWHGAFSVTVQGGKVTVAALTTPVLVQSADDAELLVPLGSQIILEKPLPDLSSGIGPWLDARKILPLPDVYLRERLNQLTSFPALKIETPHAGQDSSLLSIFDDLRLPAARQRAIQASEHSVLDDVLSALGHGDIHALQSLLLRSDVQQTLNADSSKDALPQIASLAADQDVLPLVLPFLMRDTTLWMLASLHPLVRDHVWVSVQSGAMLSPEERFTRMVAFPGSDLLPQGAADLTVRAWAQEASSLLAEHPDTAAAVLDAVLPMWGEVVQRQAQVLLPERVQQFVSALAEISAPYAAHLAPQTQDLLTQLSALPVTLAAVRLGDGASSLVASQQHSSAKERIVGVLDYRDAKKTALEALKAAGGMEAPQTLLTVMTGDAVHVSGMLFATNSGDQSFEFTYHAQAHMVDEIAKDGKVLPYEVPLTQFVSWVKQGMK